MNKYIDFKDKVCSIESVNGIPLSNEDCLEYGVYYISIKLKQNLDWANLDESCVQQYITDDTEVVSYWYDDGDVAPF